MELRKSSRRQVKLRLGLSGASGFGKTKSALLLAYGMTGKWENIAVIDTENSSASLYSDLGAFNVLDLKAPFSPERYMEAITMCEKAGMEVIIIDSVSHEWTGEGGCLQIHEKLGGRFQDWANVTPRHQSFLNKILQSTAHIITTTRRKIDYSLDIGSNGKTQVVKHGTKEITRDGYEYELTVNLELVNENHLAKASKDRTGLFANRPEFIITEETGRKILEWCNAESAVTAPTANDLRKEIREVLAAISDCNSISELRQLYNKYPDFQAELNSDFEARKAFLQKLINPKNYSTNGHHR